MGRFPLCCSWCCHPRRPSPALQRNSVSSWVHRFAPNHIGMPRVSPTLKLDFLHRQVLVSRNISGGRAVWVVLGGMDYQVEHHLFSSMPQPYLRKVQTLVAACPASRKLAGFGRLKGRDARIRHAQVHLLRPVPGGGLVWPDLVVLDAVVLGVLRGGLLTLPAGTRHVHPRPWRSWSWCAVWSTMGS